MRHRVIKRVALLSIALAAAAATAPAGAASECKGLEKRQCESKPDCAWVDSYKRKDGKTVSAYCKSSGKKKTPPSKQ